ncbi:amino acid adenylation domain-containing protein [Chitinophaga sp.]|uniref:amino acid adenylation domain-containing protein n=1 Tax=Chitinophaga sp. TaxID=1869181 RepID=UPI0031DDD933
MKDLLKDIRTNNIVLEVVNGELKVFADDGAIAPDLLFAIKERKAELIQLLSENKVRETIIPVAEHQESYPLSSAQRRLWLLSQLHGTEAYHMLKCYTLEGEVNKKAFTTAFDQLIARHEILRTVFSEDGRQYMLSPEDIGFELQHYDLCTEAEKDNLIKDLIRQQLDTPFDLSSGPLLRALLIRTGENSWVFAYVMHHIISDGWSMGVMVRELMQVYQACLSDQPLLLPELPFQYKDYAVWQQARLNSTAMDRDKAYWLQQFAGAIPLPELPTDRPRPALKQYKGSVIHRTFSHHVIPEFNTLLQEEGSTLFMGLLSVVYLLLYRYTGQEDLIVGSAVAGREHPDLEDQIGFYLNTLPLMCNIKGENSFREILACVKNMTLEAFEHQSFPFDELITALDLSRDTSKNPLFDVMVVLQNLDGYQLPEKGPGFNVQPYSVITPTTSKFDLNFVFITGKGQLQVEIEYNSDLFDGSTIQRLGEHLEQLLHMVTFHPEQPVQQLQYISSSERHLLLNVFNQTNTHFPDNTTLIHLFEEQVRKQPLKEAVVFEHTRLTFSALNETANQLGWYLQEVYKSGPGDIIAIQLHRSEWMIMAILGVLKSGAAYLPIDPDLPQERIDYIIADSGCKAVINKNELDCFQQGKEVWPTANIEVSTSPTDLAYVIYTSGSTGMPKGCMLEHRGVINRIEWMWHQFDFRTDDVILQKTAFTFDVSVWEIFMPLCWGTSMVLCTEQDMRSPEALISLIAENKITCLHFVPGMFSAFTRYLNGAGEKLYSLRRIITSGEALTPSTVGAWYSMTTIPVHNLYGPTEASIDVSYYTAVPGDTHIPIGRPVWNTRLYILDSMGQLQGVGVPGEICIAGIGLARGYLNKPALTAEKFINNPFEPGQRLYRTGDLGKWLPDGNILYLGRLDDQVKIRGYRIELNEITTTLQQFPGISGAVVIVRELPDEEKELVAYIVAADVIDMEAVGKFLFNKLPAYMVPAHLVRLDFLPFTTNGKIDRKQLPDPVSLNTGYKRAYIAPVTEMEKMVAAVAEEVTGRSAISMNDHFFAVGGDSIKIITFAVNIRKRAGLNVSVKKLYEQKTLADWAAYLAAEQDGKQEGVDHEIMAGLEAISKIKARIEEEDQVKKRLPAYYEDIYPLVEIEQGMIFSSLLNPYEPVYYDQYSFILNIRDLDLFTTRLQQLVRRHPILRTRYYINSFSLPLKVVMREIALPLSIDDLSGMQATEQEAHIRQYVADDLAIRLSFDDELLWRVHLCRLDKDRYHLTYSVHHALMDGWSMAVFKTEMTRLETGALPSLRYSYKEYCAITLGRKRTTETSLFWQQLLEGYSRNKLPFNYKGLRISKEPGMKKVGSNIDKQLLDELLLLSSNFQVSFKAICVAAHVCLLHIICPQEDVVTGVVTHERPEIEGGENILGCFLNTVPIRISFEKESDILSLLKRVNDYLYEVKGHEVHLSEIARMIGDKTSTGNPIFDTLLNFTDFHTYANIDRNDLIDIMQAGEDSDTSYEMTNTLFDVEVSKTFDRFYARIKYAPAYFDEENVRYALDLYIRILQKFAADVYASVHSLAMLTPQEWQEVIIGFNDTAVPYSRDISVHGLFEEQARRTPLAVALRQNKMDMSYSSLNAQANRLARCLIDKGVKEGDNVGLLVTRSFHMIIGMYAILKAGGAYVPVDPTYPPDRQQYIISNSKVQQLLTDDMEMAGKLEGVVCLSVDNSELLHYSHLNPDLVHNPHNLAYTIYTSGSTGRPKGVMIEHHAAVNLIQWVNQTFHVNEQDRLLFITSMCFDLSVYEIFGMLAAGGTVVIASNDEVQQVSVLKRMLTDERITFWDSVPTTMSFLTAELEGDQDGYQQQDLRLVFLSGDWIPVQLPPRIKQYFPAAHVISLGGATEATVWSNYFPIEIVDPLWSSIPYGKPIHNNTFYILNEQLQPVPKGVAGELYIGGVGVARGYANDPEKTAAAFRDDPFNSRLGGKMYKTGDLGRMLPDGNMEFLGRKDNQVKIRGFRVELGEIESVLLRHKGIRGAIVHVYKGSDHSNELCAYLLTEQQPDLKEIKHYLKAKLPAYMVPAYYMVLDAFPLNSNGKINRNALPLPFTNDDSQSPEYIPPKNPIQQQVADIWQSVLNVDRISIHANLFELGASSLSVGAFVNRIQREMQIRLDIRTIFINPSIDAISFEIQRNNPDAIDAFQMEDIGDAENFTI